MKAAASADAMMATGIRSTDFLFRNGSSVFQRCIPNSQIRGMPQGYETGVAQHQIQAHREYGKYVDFTQHAAKILRTRNGRTDKIKTG